MDAANNLIWLIVPLIIGTVLILGIIFRAGVSVGIMLTFLVSGFIAYMFADVVIDTLIIDIDDGVEGEQYLDLSGLDEIYYNPAQEEDSRLQTAAEDLETYLEAMSGEEWTVVTLSPPTPPAIYLSVDATDLGSYTDDAFNFVVDGSGVTITGKSAMACRNGAYYLLDEELGVRWFKKGSAWTVVPDILQSIVYSNEIHDADWVTRLLWVVSTTDADEVADWAMRNKLYGNISVRIGHSYAAIHNEGTGLWQPTEVMWDANPERYLPDVPDVPAAWQLDPTDATILQWSKDYVDSELGGSFGGANIYNDTLTIIAVPVSPRDGLGWDPPYNDNEEITDMVFDLANDVADYVDAGEFVTVYSYSSYSETPDIGVLEPNLLAFIADQYNSSTMMTAERFENMVNEGALVGLRGYLNVTNWYWDLVRLKNDTANQFRYWSDFGVQYYDGESVDTWGGAQGVSMYLIAKLLWDSDLVVDDLLDDFYNEAYGDAADDMEIFYEHIRSTTPQTPDYIDDTDLSVLFNALDDAMTVAAGDNDVLARIRQEICYTYFLWWYHNIQFAGMNQAECEALYTFMCMTRDWYICNFENGQANDFETLIRNELKGTYGLTDGEVDALQDFGTPTNAEVATYLSDGLTEFGTTEIPSTNVRYLNLVALGNTEEIIEDVIRSYSSKQIIVLSSGSETITVRYMSDTAIYMRWVNTYGVVTDTYEHVGAVGVWTNVNFTTDEAGIYMLYVLSTSGVTTVDIQNTPAALVADPHNDLFEGADAGTVTRDTTRWYSHVGGDTLYFYVPAGISSFTFHATADAAPNFDVTGDLIEPDEVTTHPFSFENTGDVGDSITVNNPPSGLWRLDFDQSGTYQRFWFIGIPPLVWHDPEFLLIPAS